MKESAVNSGLYLAMTAYGQKPTLKARLVDGLPKFSSEKLRFFFPVFRTAG